MNQYWDTVQKMLIYLKTRNQCASSRKSHQQCYEELGNYLEENGLAFSEDSTKQCVQSIKGKHNRQRVYFWSRYVRQLVKFCHTGSVPDELFYQILPAYEKVPEYLKVDLSSLRLHSVPSIQVHGKGDKDRIVSLSAATIPHLKTI